MFPSTLVPASATAVLAQSHPMGAWAMAAVLATCFIGVLGGAIAVTLFLDRHRQAGAERSRKRTPLPPVGTDAAGVNAPDARFVDMSS